MSLFHPPLYSPASPILSHDLFSRYVDDIIFSANFSLSASLLFFLHDAQWLSVYEKEHLNYVSEIYVKNKKNI
jgi:hypothetical protein